MDHVVYVDAKSGEMEKILAGAKTMIVRGATGRKLPYGRVYAGDRLYFIQNNGDGLVCASAEVVEVFNSEKLSESESCLLIQEHRAALQLEAAQIKRWSSKRYLTLISITNPVAFEPFEIDRSEYGNMDDWLPVGEIDRVRVQAALTGAAE